MSSNQIANLQKILNVMLENERVVLGRKYNEVMRELKRNVEEFDAPSSFNRFVQEECNMRNTHRRDRLEREFWEMSLDHKQWRCVENTSPSYVFFYVDNDGIACRDASNMQMISV